MKREYKKYGIIMMLCFILGGFSIVSYLLMIYGNVWRMENIPPQDMINVTEFNRTPGRDQPQVRNFFSPGPPSFAASTFSIILLFNGIILLLGGICIWMLTKDKELVTAKEKLTSLLLQPEERLVIDEMKKYEGSITQSLLVKNTGMSKVKAHRIINRLVLKGVIKKYPYGLTNKLVLEKDV